MGNVSFTWGDPITFGVGPINLSFAGIPFQSFFETPFKTGTLSYFNGTVASLTSATAIDLRLQLNLITLTGITQYFDYGLGLITTPDRTVPGGVPDYVIFPCEFGTNSFVYNVSTYTLQLSGFKDPISGLYVSEFHVAEGFGDSADLYGKLTVNTNPQVPEAGTLGLALSGLVGIVGFARRRMLV